MCNIIDDNAISIEEKVLAILKLLCPDFAPYNFLKKYDLYKGSLFGGTNLYLKKGENDAIGMVTTQKNKKLYNLEKYPYNFKTISNHNGLVEYGWSGDILLEMLEELKAKYYGTDKPTSDYFNDEDYHEGHIITVNVNRYERSSIARDNCIAFHGSKCKICELDFGEVYGDIGEGFIHVHHLKPLHTIAKDYIVDYKKDLIPVCPNCHAMIHRIKNAQDMTIEQIKEVLFDN
jgi:predicted HNH restriction endonuclease